MPKITLEEPQKGTSSLVQRDGADEHGGRDEIRGGGGEGRGGRRVAEGRRQLGKKEKFIFRKNIHIF